MTLALVSEGAINNENCVAEFASMFPTALVTIWEIRTVKFRWRQIKEKCQIKKLKW